MEEKLNLFEISKSFGEIMVLNKFFLSFPTGQTTCLLGPSGCGKTTLLRIIAGILKPDQGKLKDFENLTFSFVFQEDRLLPWKTAAENIGLVLKNKLGADDMRAVIDQNLKLVKMQEYGSYYPHQLSGGMRQRISFARAFSFPSDVILLDEPFKGLDLSLKQNLMENVRNLLKSDSRTVIYVTHDPEEAVYFGSKVILLSDKPIRILEEFSVPTAKIGKNWDEELIARIKDRIQAKQH
jgi:NitT/TauT family transport system ATP-binding protein